MNDAEAFRPIPLAFYFQAFESLNEYHHDSDAPYMRPTFYSLRVHLGLYDAENLLGDLGRTLGMPAADIEAALNLYRPYTARREGPTDPPEF